MVALRDDLSSTTRSFFERDEQTRIRATLARTPVFAGLDEDTLAELAYRMKVRRVPGGSAILNQDDPADALYVLMAGRAKVVMVGENGREVTLRVLRAGDVFGESGLFDDRRKAREHGSADLADTDGRGGTRRSASVVALEPITALSLGRDDLLRHMASHPATAVQFLGEMSRRLRAADETIAELALCDVQERLVRKLVRLAREDDHPVAEGLVIRRKPTQQDLANMVGSCRETISRTFNSMVRKGLILVTGRSLVLTPALVAMADRPALAQKAA